MLLFLLALCLSLLLLSLFPSKTLMSLLHVLLLLQQSSVQ